MSQPQLDRIVDPRSFIEKFSRKELEYLARFEGRNDIDPGMPVELMREAFRANQPRQWPKPMFTGIGQFAGMRRTPPYDEWQKVAFGIVSAPEPAQPEIKEISAMDNLRAEWEKQKAQPATIPVAQNEQPQPKQEYSTAERNRAIYYLHQNGVSNNDISEKFGISKARVSQIITRAKRQNGQNASK